MNPLISEIQDSTWKRLGKLFTIILLKLKPDKNAEEFPVDSYEPLIFEETKIITLEDATTTNEYLNWVERYGNTVPEYYFTGDEYTDKLKLRGLTPGFNQDSYAVYRLKACVESISAGLSERDSSNLRPDFAELYSICNEMETDIESEYELVESLLNILDVRESRLIYLPPPKSILLPQLIVEANDDLIRMISDRPSLIFEISPRKFEEIIADIFFKKGFEVELTKSTRDGGRDIVAIYNHMDINTKYLIECKRYARANKVSIDIVQRLFGVKIAEAANKAILATTSTFTKDARHFASNHLWDLDLKDYEDVMRWIRQVNRHNST